MAEAAAAFDSESSRMLQVRSPRCLVKYYRECVMNLPQRLFDETHRADAGGHTNRFNATLNPY
jgi:hypothetical protein